MEPSYTILIDILRFIQCLINVNIERNRTLWERHFRTIIQRSQKTVPQPKSNVENTTLQERPPHRCDSTFPQRSHNVRRHNHNRTLDYKAYTTFPERSITTFPQPDNTTLWGRCVLVVQRSVLAGQSSCQKQGMATFIKPILGYL